MHVNYFRKMLIVDVWQGSEYASDFEYASVLNIQGLWINQGYEYIRVLNMLLVLNMSRFWLYHGQHARIAQGSEYARMSG